MNTLAYHIQNACDSLKANRTRTLLTITGVAIGIASIVTILSLSSGATRIVTRQIDDIGGNVIVVRPGTKQETSLTAALNQQLNGAISSSSLTEADAQLLRKLPTVTSVAPLLLTSASVTGDTTEPATLIGTSPAFLDIAHASLQEGEFNDATQAPITIGAQLSIQLFGTEDSLGKILTIKGREFSVGGVIERQQNPLNFNGVDIDTAILMHPSQLRSISPSAQVQQINVQTTSAATLDASVIAINKLLLQQHGGEADFHTLTGKEITAPMGQLFFVIAGVTTLIASISLFVGGIGIMNIMLVNVAERTREIGIRKALGATRGDILWQFLVEAIIMALLGGIIGGALGLTVAFIISLFLTFDPVITWQLAVVSIGVASGVGVLFGLYPALRAAHKHPIEALNQQS
jgi:ABC-type antimicrobial peptide transport system permease subunit